jgi:hypothetical protein
MTHEHHPLSKQHTCQGVFGFGGVDRMPHLFQMYFFSIFKIVKISQTKISCVHLHVLRAPEVVSRKNPFFMCVKMKKVGCRGKRRNFASALECGELLNRDIHADFFLQNILTFQKIIIVE